jgi:DcmR-like sensory protein
MAPERTKAPVHTFDHAVQFYGSDEALCSAVAAFLSDGLVSAQPAIVIATYAHRKAISAQLAAGLIDIERAQRIGDLIMLDARDTLATFMVGDDPDPQLFNEHVGDLIATTLHNHPRTIVRAYGEMVNLLWREGRTVAATRLEILWNQLAVTHRFALVCGYSMGSFFKQAELFQDVLCATAFQEVCRHRSTQPQPSSPRH